MPNANSDYVFAIIGEELGLLGCLVVLALFALFAFTGMRIARRSADPFVRLVAGGATVWICGQAVINIGYVTGLLPVTGIPLPFISAGGTSLLATFFVLGMLVSFARHEPAAVEARPAGRERRGSRSRVERWARIPVPQAYVARPKRAARRARPRSRTARPRAPGERGATPRARPTRQRGHRARRARPATAAPAGRRAPAARAAAPDRRAPRARAPRCSAPRAGPRSSSRAGTRPGTSSRR